MTDSVKFIFKTLIKVPIIIFIAFAIFNIFSFCFIYFRMLGLSYVVMQTAVENNYLPASETNTLIDHIRDTSAISMVEEAGLIIGGDTDAKWSTYPHRNENPKTSSYITESNGHKYLYVLVDSDADKNDESQIRSELTGYGAFSRKQYGNNVTVGVYCKYRIIWPLDYRYTGNRDAIMNSANGQYTYEEVNGYNPGKSTRKGYTAGFSDLDIVITYTVPGLKYYPDLNVY